MSKESRKSAVGMMVVASGLAAAVPALGANGSPGQLQCNGRPHKTNRGIIVCDGRAHKVTRGIIVCNGKPQRQVRSIVVCNGKPQESSVRPAKRVASARKTVSKTAPN